MLRAVDQRCKAVSRAVDVDKLAVCGNGVGAHKVIIAREGIVIELLDLLR